MSLRNDFILLKNATWIESQEAGLFVFILANINGRASLRNDFIILKYGKWIES